MKEEFTQKTVDSFKCLMITRQVCFCLVDLCLVATGPFFLWALTGLPCSTTKGTANHITGCVFINIAAWILGMVFFFCASFVAVQITAAISDGKNLKKIKAIVQE